jgi:hypothetical protein
MPVKSIMTRPAGGSWPVGRELSIEGVAFSGAGEISAVEVSADGGAHWLPADLVGERSPYAWRLWRRIWIPDREGTYTVLSRATDRLGHRQPMETPWNPGGFLWNAVDRVTVRVEAP